MTQTILNLAAMCDKAGRPMNQDNFLVRQDLSNTDIVSVNNDDRDVTLSEKGALVVVADGMGGMNAGEVASKIVVEAVKYAFSSIPADVLQDEKKIKRFIHQTIVDADKEIKLHAKEHPETSGMGSTIVILWILGDKAYVGWCGDSRAYCFNPQNKLVRLTHDHSYVQDLVDHNKISEHEAFDHPDSNIITRSLGDFGQRANPDVEAYPLHKDDVFLLCSDGLCGLLRDEEIESIIRANATSMKTCLMELWNQGTRIGWTDNATVELVRVKEGAAPASDIAIGWEENNPVTPTKKTLEPSQPEPEKTGVVDKIQSKKWWIISCVAFVIGVLIGLLIGKHTGKNNIGKIDGSSEEQVIFWIQQNEILKQQNDSLKNLLDRNEKQSIASNRGSDKPANQTSPTNNKAKDPKTQQPATPTPAPAPEPSPIPEPGLTVAPSAPAVPDCSSIDSDYLKQIKQTVSDYDDLERKTEDYSLNNASFTNEQYSNLKMRWKDIKNNIESIKQNDSYPCLDPDQQDQIKKIGNQLDVLAKKIEDLKANIRETRDTTFRYRLRGGGWR